LNLSYNSAHWRSKDLLLRSSCIDICVTFRLTGSSCTAQHSKSLRQERKTPTKQDPCTVRNTGNGYRNDSSSVRTFPNFIVCYTARGARDRNGCLGPVPRLDTKAQGAEPVAALVVDPSRQNPGPTARRRGVRNHNGRLRPVPRLDTKAQGAEPAAGRSSGALVEDRGRQGCTLRSRWRSGPTQRWGPVVDLGRRTSRPQPE
jgi:hypothetical protein